MKMRLIYVVIVIACFSCTKEKAKLIDPTKVKDVDGNMYGTVRIGNQVWMTSNLKTKHYRNGDELLDGSGENWKWYCDHQDTRGMWCNISMGGYNNHKDEVLYDRYAVNDPRGICPEGWHMPSIEEVNALVNFVGGPSYGGNRLKAKVTWLDPTGRATDDYNFSALADGYRGGQYYYGIDRITYFWTTTRGQLESNQAFYLLYDTSSVQQAYGTRTDGFSCRCLQD